MIEIYRSGFGDIELSVRRGKLIRLGFGPSKAVDAGISEISAADKAVMDIALAWLDGYFSGKISDFDRALADPDGTVYQKRVWSLLWDIRPGTARSYGQVAKRYEESFGIRTSPRAVGSAVGANPTALIIPCHRVIGSDGSLVGYAYGLELKKMLLDHEARFCGQ